MQSDAIYKSRYEFEIPLEMLYLTASRFCLPLYPKIVEHCNTSYGLFKMGNTYTADILDKLIHQDPQAFEQFYMQTVDIFYRFVKTHYRLPEDDIQQVISELYIRLRNNIHRYDSSHKFETWYWTIFRNLLKDWFKKQHDYHFGDFAGSDDEDVHSLEEDIEADQDDVLTLVEHQIQYEHIVDALSKLELEYAEVLHLKYVESKSNEEIASWCGISLDNVRQRLSRGLKKIKNILASDFPI